MRAGRLGLPRPPGHLGGVQDAPHLEARLALPLGHGPARNGARHREGHVHPPADRRGTAAGPARA
eukprot:6482987-Alexandrium_andersonii.AAC.1